MSDEDAFDREHERIVEGMLGRPLTAREREGFLVVYPRFIDRFGGSRLHDLARIFSTHSEMGRRALGISLEDVAEAVGSYAEFVARYPVTIVPPAPAYPLFPIRNLESLRPVVYRVLNSGRPGLLAQIRATRRLPLITPPIEPVLRTTPRGHWCTYEKWVTPEATRDALQILPGWSDCAARATLSTSDLLAYVAYSVDPNDPGTRGLAFHGYFYEPVTQDHDDQPYEYLGGAVQICVYGNPQVSCLEVWDDISHRWEMAW